MRLSVCVLSGAGLACLLVACSGDPNAALTGPSPSDPTGSGGGAQVQEVQVAHHKPGHGEGGGGGDDGGGGGQDHSITVDLSGGIVAAGQPAVIDRDTKSRLKILAGVDNGLAPFVDAFNLFELVNSPPESLASPGSCVVIPSDADATIVQRLIDRLDGPAGARNLDGPKQARNRVVVQIDKNNLGQESAQHTLTHNWEDVEDGRRYRTWLVARDRVVRVSKVSEDVYEFRGGNIVNWDTAANVEIVCPHDGTITLTLTR